MGKEVLGEYRIPIRKNLLFFQDKDDHQAAANNARQLKDTEDYGSSISSKLCTSGAHLSFFPTVYSFLLIFL
uniref:Uncharacterized protein n=1 Tax=Caenorhabditis japonica TaxID=281687 RepID=A0A8R1ISV7_CAEJA